MNFKDFCNTAESMKTDTKNIQKENKNVEDNINNLKKESVEEKLEEYSKLSNTELMQEFLKESVKAKESGMYDEAQIENIKTTLFPFLNEDQKVYFEKLIGMVK